MKNKTKNDMRIGNGVVAARESEFLRRVTTFVVALVAAAVLAASVSFSAKGWQLAGTGDAAAQDEGSADAAGTTAEDGQSVGTAGDDGQPSKDSAPQNQDGGMAADSGQGEASTQGEAQAQQSPASAVNATQAAAAQGLPDVRPTRGYVIVAGRSDFASLPEFAQLTEAIEAFESQGYTLSFTIVDLGTGGSVRYRSDEYYYSASSIKGPFTVAGYETGVDAGLVDAAVADPLAERTLVESDNAAYLQLRDLFGVEGFESWLEDASVGPGLYLSLGQLAEVHYPRLTTDQEAQMWTHAYAYLSGDGPSAQKLVSYLQRREVSPIKSALGGSYDTWSKAGWIAEYADGGVEPATWDSGVVFASSGTYVVSIASNAPADLGALTQLVPALDAVHTALVA